MTASTGKRTRKGAIGSPPNALKEPVYKGEVDVGKMASALNWYSYVWDTKKSILALSAYLKSRGDEEGVKALRSVPEGQVNLTLCRVARMITNGSVVGDPVTRRIDEHVDYLKEVVDEAKSESDNKPTVHDYVEEQVSEMTEDIDLVIDSFLQDGYRDQKFDCYGWLGEKAAKAVHARKIADMYRPLLEELGYAIDDEEYSEAYSKMKVGDIRRFMKMIQSIIDDCETWAENQSKARAPKKKKVPKKKSPEKMVEKVQYLKEDRDLKVVSVPPEKIIGSQEVWLYNAKHRKLTQLTSLEGQGLTVSGTTVRGFDEALSGTKSVRKPLEVLSSLVKAKKKDTKKIMNDIRTKTYEARGRINKDTVILRVDS